MTQSMQSELVTAPVVPWVAMALLASALAHTYLWLRLVREPARPRALALVLVALALIVPAGMLGLLYMRVLPRALARPLMTGAFTYVGALCFLLAVLLGLDILTRVGLRMHARRKASLALVAAAILSTVAIAQALRTPRIHEQRVQLATLPAGLVGYRIVQLSDLHIGPTLGLDFVDALVTATNAQHPDLVVITGDLVDGSVHELAPLLRPLRALAARDGVFLVLGNHEYLSGAEEWAAFLPSLRIRVLRNECVPISAALELVGLDDASKTRDGRVPADLARAYADHDASRFTIALVHEPAFVAQVKERGAALQLSGHTHGGQVFPVHFLELLDQGYLEGLYRVGATVLHVSPGAGFWGPPMRLGSRSELSVLALSR